MRKKLPENSRLLPFLALLLLKYGGDWVKNIAERIDLTVIYAYDVEYQITIGKQ